MMFAGFFSRFAPYIAVIGLLGAMWGWHVHSVNQARQEVYAKWAASNVQRNQIADREALANAAESKRRENEKQKGIDDANQKIQAALADARSARDSASRLQQRVSKLIADSRRAAAHPTAGSAGPTAERDPIDLLADVQRRIDEAAGQLAEYADAARIAGSACERQYDALIQ